ncbi:major urinary protein-like [Petaurus breviceps papuanus]|uniref:major urinary protein-like n=1 Tax=Petaurus breviceps papuanus TaxID=3040969 RepID=UPI0036D9EF45
MGLLLLTMGLALLCTLQVRATGSVNEINFNKLLGRWYPLFLASNDVGSNSAAFIHSIDMKADHLIFYFTLRRGAECSQVPVFGYKLENNKYKLRYPGNHVLYLEDADPNDYLLISTINDTHGMESKGVELYSRHKGEALNQDIKSKFEKIYKSHGLKKENVVDLMKIDPCSRLLE